MGSGYLSKRNYYWKEEQFKITIRKNTLIYYMYIQRTLIVIRYRTKKKIESWGSLTNHKIIEWYEIKLLLIV